MTVDVRYCTTADGVQIAYSVIGDGPPLVRVLGWFTHLEYELKTPMWRGFRETFSKRYSTVVYDGRGTGLSDRNAGQFTRQGFLNDLDAVLNATGFEKRCLYSACRREDQLRSGTRWSILSECLTWCCTGRSRELSETPRRPGRSLT